MGPPGAVLGKKIGGLAPHHLGGNNEQNYCVQLSSIKQLMYRYHNYPENWGGGEAGQDLGGPVPPGPNIEPQLGTTNVGTFVERSRPPLFTSLTSLHLSCKYVL